MPLAPLVCPPWHLKLCTFLGLLQNVFTMENAVIWSVNKRSLYEMSMLCFVLLTLCILCRQCYNAHLLSCSVGSQYIIIAFCYVIQNFLLQLFKALESSRNINEASLCSTHVQHVCAERFPLALGVRGNGPFYCSIMSY